MKTINSKKTNEVEIFHDHRTKECIGFCGSVRLYDVDIYIDTRTGQGYDEVIKKLSALVRKFSMRFHFNGNSLADTKHDIIVHILEGIPKYNPTRNTKLSTFIEMRVGRRLINDLRDKSRMSKDATYLNIGTFHIVCHCGNDFVATINCSDLSAHTCAECGRSVSCARKMVAVNTPEVNESMLCSNDNNGTIAQTNMQLGDRDQIMKAAAKPLDEEVIFRHDMQAFLETADPRLVKIFELIYFQDYSISAAAEKVGLSGAGANMKLKDLQDNKAIQELFNRINQ